MTAACLHDRGMRPADFWALSLPELAMVLGCRGGGGVSRAALEALMARFPDG